MWVTISSAQRSPKSSQIGSGKSVIGRDPACHVVIEDPHVSLQHAQLEVTRGGAWLTDLQSTNGTFVTGGRLQRPVWLDVPAEFRIGETTVRLTVNEPTVALGVVPDPPRWHGARGPATSAPAAPWESHHARDAGPMARGDVAISGGRDAAGRDLVIHEGFKLRTRMRRSAKDCIRLGCVLLLAGFGLFGYFVITWNNEIFDAVTDSTATEHPDLPSPLPWLPLGAGLMFAGLVLVVTGLLIPRDRVVTRSHT